MLKELRAKLSDLEDIIRTKTRKICTSCENTVCMAEGHFGNLLNVLPKMHKTIG